jgi:hypothetical protein
LLAVCEDRRNLGCKLPDDLAPNFIDPLLEKYRFENVKWIVVPRS